MKMVFIHFWLLQCDHPYRQTPFLIDELINYWQEMLTKTLLMCNDNTKSLIVDVTPELIDIRTQTEYLQNFIDQVKLARPDLKIFLIFNESIVENVDLKFDKVDDILCLDYLLVTYFSILVKRTPYCNPSWDPTSDKLLFLIRRPFSQHRIGLLRRLLELGMENDLKWSLTDIEGAKNYFSLSPEEYIKKCSEFLPGMSEKETQTFIEKNSKIFGPTLLSSGHCHVTNDEETVKDMYSSTLGEIVSETNFHISDPILLSEKIFKTISHQMPFLLLGQEKSEDRLKNMGFYTFDINNSSIRDQKIITLLKNGLDPKIFFQTSNHVDKFPEFYKIFRDTSWPTEVNWHDLRSLSFNIQAEIIEGFFSAEEIRIALRIQTSIDRIVSFKESLVNNKEKVKMMTEHNFKRFNDLGEKYVSDLKKFITRNNIDLDYLEFLKFFYETPADIDERRACLLR